MIVTISGKAGSGKSTIGKLLAKKLKLKHYSMGDLQRKIAKEKRISILELGKLEEKDSSIDKELDNKQKELGEKEDNLVIDGRLSAFFIPNSIKIFLDADETTRAKRILNDKREDERYKDLKQAIQSMRKREDSENKRYKKYYGFDCYDKKNYDYIVDNTNLSVDEVVKKILKITNLNKS